MLNHFTIRDIFCRFLASNQPANIICPKLQIKVLWLTNSKLDNYILVKVFTMIISKFSFYLDYRLQLLNFHGKAMIQIKICDLFVANDKTQIKKAIKKI